MVLKSIRKDLEEILTQNASMATNHRIVDRFGADYIVLGVDLFLIKEISQVIIENLPGLDMADRSSLIMELVTSQKFEKVWLGYSIWSNSISSFDFLEQSVILFLRPNTIGVFNHFYATSILPYYIRTGKVGKGIFIQLSRSGNMADQQISLRSFMIVSQKSAEYSGLAIELLENGNWSANKDISKMVASLSPYYNKLHKSENI